MNLLVYPRLSTCSKRAMLRVGKRYGHYYYYTPRGHLLNRLTRELGMTHDQVIAQIHKERQLLLRHIS